MGSGREFSRSQQGIIKRYYRNLDTITVHKLSEIVSELYMAAAEGDSKKLERLWKRADAALAKTDATDVRVRKALEDRSVEQLAKLVSELAG